jgi:hypothetical protein
VKPELPAPNSQNAAASRERTAHVGRNRARQAQAGSWVHRSRHTQQRVAQATLSALEHSSVGASGATEGRHTQQRVAQATLSALEQSSVGAMESGHTQQRVTHATLSALEQSSVGASGAMESWHT